MAKKVIPKEIQQEVFGIIEKFNKKHFRGRTDSVAYFAEMKGGLEAFPVWMESSNHIC